MKRHSRPEHDPDELRDIVNSLLSGMSLSRVPEHFHSHLLVPISAAKNEAIVAGNYPQVKRLQAIMQELQLNPGKRMSSPRKTARSQSAFVTARCLKDEEHPDIKLTIDELLDGRDIETIDGADLSRLIPALKERKQIALSQGNYRQSQQLENLIQSANSRYYEATYTSVQNSRLTNLRVQLMKAREDLEAAEEFWTRAREEHDQEYTTSLESLETLHQQQLSDLDSSFPESLPAKYAKVSAHCLNLREQEKHLVLSKRYEDAIALRERADRLEEVELETQRRRFQRAFETRRRQLTDAQDIQRACFERNWERKLDRFEKERDHDLNVLRRTITNFEARIDAIENDKEVATVERTRVPSNMNPRVRNVAASKLTRKLRVRRV
jgi:hypothetical protein